MFMSKAQPRATKEYYPPHLTGRGSRGLMALAFELFALGFKDGNTVFNILSIITTVHGAQYFIVF